MPPPTPKSLSTATDNSDNHDSEQPSWDTSLVTKPAYLVALCRWLRKKEQHRLLVERGVAMHKHLLEYYADIAPSVLRDEPLELPDADFGSRIVPHPAGVVAAVTPWNYPLMQAVCKLAPALAAGCPVLLKPSPLASLYLDTRSATQAHQRSTPTARNHVNPPPNRSRWHAV